MAFKKEFKFAIYSIIALVIIISAYFLVFGYGETDDTTAPTLTVLSEDIYVYQGEEAIITVNFSDNEEVTVATLYYRMQDETEWNERSIINKSVTLSISASETTNILYFVTVNDEAGNGPIGDPSTNGSIYYTIYILETNPDDGDNGDDQRYVFIEEATRSSCSNCPDVASILYDLYNSGNYQFYYVSVSEDNPVVASGLKQEYNFYGYPTTYIDGGYIVKVGKNSQSDYVNAIEAALARDAPDVSISINAEKENSSDQVTYSVRLINNENTEYTGTLRVYLTEIISTQWRDYNGNANHYAFMEFLIDQSITINAQTTKWMNQSFDASSYDPENLMLYAVIFNTESHQKYSNPPDGNEFTAHYADNVDATTVVEGGDLPPNVGISHPKKGKIHLFGNVLLQSLNLNNAFLIGRTTFTAQATDPEGLSIEKVEFYLDGDLVQTCTTTPYEWKMTGPSIFQFQHTVRVIAYDEGGKSSTAEEDYIAFILF